VPEFSSFLCAPPPGSFTYQTICSLTPPRNTNSVTPVTIPPTVYWWWSEQLVDLIHSKWTLFSVVPVICCSSELKWDTFVIIHSIRVTEVPTVSTSFSEGYMRDCSLSLHCLKYKKTLVNFITWEVRHILHASQLTPQSSCLAIYICYLLSLVLALQHANFQEDHDAITCEELRWRIIRCPLKWL
jgi:hypothetical protein